ncbi:hypothetical protein TNCV_4213691 [Trichonephila clavipes]|nr:hypothetical protein TNCV_4213691 [Trichonephila clavipes]
MCSERKYGVGFRPTPCWISTAGTPTTSSQKDSHFIRMTLMDRPTTSQTVCQESGSFSLYEQLKDVCSSIESHLGDHDIEYH